MKYDVKHRGLSIVNRRAPAKSRASEEVRA